MKYLLIYHKIGLGHIIAYNTILNNLINHGYHVEIVCIKRFKEYFNMFYPEIIFHSLVRYSAKSLLKLTNQQKYDKICLLRPGTKIKNIGLLISKKYHNKIVLSRPKFDKGSYQKIKEENSYISELNPIENIYIKTQFIQKKPYEIIFNKYIALSPFSSTEEKDYPIDKMVQIIDYFIEKYDINIVIPGIACNLVTKQLIKLRTKNHSRYEQFKKKSKFPKKIQIFNCDMCNLIKTIHYSTFSISMDSGPWHVSNSLKKKSIAIFPTRNIIWHYEKSDIINDNMEIHKVIPPESCNCLTITDIPVTKIIDEIEIFNKKHTIF